MILKFLADYVAYILTSFFSPEMFNKDKFLFLINKSRMIIEPSQNFLFVL